MYFLESMCYYEMYVFGYLGYWESLQQQLDAHMARARLRELHQEKLRSKLAALRQQVCQQKNNIILIQS